MVALSFQGWGLVVNSITIVSDGGVMISYGSAITSRVGLGVELAAGRVKNPNNRVGLAATLGGNGIGLAASIWLLCG